jgi:flagellin
MSFSVNTNNNALAALQTLNMTQRSMSTTQAHINTGYKVAGAADNASTFAIAQGMRGDIAGLNAVSQAINLGQATVAVASSAAQSISDKLNQLKDKVTQAQGQNVDRAKIQQDIDSLVSSIGDIGNAAQFNGVNLLNNSSPNGLDVVTSLNRTASSGSGSVSVVTTNVAAQDLRTSTLGIQGLSITGNTSVKFDQASGLTFANGDTISLTVKNDAGNDINYTFELTDGNSALTTATDTTTDPQAAAGTVAVAVVSDTATDTPSQTLGKIFTAMRDNGFTVKNNEDGSFSVTSSGTMTAATSSNANLTAGTIGTDAAAAMDTVESAIAKANASAASLGTMTNQLQAQGDFVKSLTDTLTEGVGTLVDADLAEESATLQALQTKQQLGIQALSIANQSSGAVLSLFR